MSLYYPKFDQNTSKQYFPEVHSDLYVFFVCILWDKNNGETKDEVKQWLNKNIVLMTAQEVFISKNAIVKCYKPISHDKLNT